MGGGSFRSRSSGSSFGGSRSFSSPSFGGGGGGGTRYVPVPVPIGPRYSYGPVYHTGYSSGGGGWIVFLILVGIVVIVVVVAVRSKRKAQAQEDAENRISPARVQLGLQMQAWAVTERLESIARRAHTEDPDGLRMMLQQSVAAMRPYLANIEYAAADQKPALDPPDAERAFGQWTGEARLTYDREVVRADKFGVQGEQREVATDGIHDEDGQLAVAEFFVVSIVLATRGFTLPKVRGSDDLMPLLTALAGVTASNLVALEIAWSPAAKSDAMSRDDMESTFPALRPL